MEKYLKDYYDLHPTSLKLHEKAKARLPLGVSSNLRAYKPYPFFVEKSGGSKVWDVDNNEYIDCQLAYGPVMVGHNNPVLSKAIKEQIDRGVTWAMPHVKEEQAAELLQERYPCAEVVRFSCSGTEATMHAIRIARAHTGKDKIIKLEGGFHGTHDNALISIHPDLSKTGPSYAPTSVIVSTGVPQNTVDNVIIVPYNDIDALEYAIERYEGEIAAFILEPVMTNSSLILPRDNYLQKVREITERENIVLIFDEIISGIRASYGGATEVYGVQPDIVTLSKAIAGGYPLSAICGKREIMAEIEKGCAHFGTFGGNPLSLTACVTVLGEILTREATDTLIKKSDAAFKEMESILKKSGVPHNLVHLGAVGSIVFTDADVKDYRSMSTLDYDIWFKFFITMLNKGVIMIGADPTETIFFSVMHTDEDYEKILKAFKETIDTL
jgi:glutamate-1-semialdehyde 2,1-aminomutase